MWLGAFLQYSEYTVSRHLRVGRSTCRVHPCKQENKVKPGPVPQQIPHPALPRQPSFRCSPVPSGRFGHWSPARTTCHQGDTHTHPAPWQLCRRTMSSAHQSSFHTTSKAHSSAHPCGDHDVYLSPSQCAHFRSHCCTCHTTVHFLSGNKYEIEYTALTVACRKWGSPANALCIAHILPPRLYPDRSAVCSHARVLMICPAQVPRAVPRACHSLYRAPVVRYPLYVCFGVIRDGSRSHLSRPLVGHGLLLPVLVPSFLLHLCKSTLLAGPTRSPAPIS